MKIDDADFEAIELTVETGANIAFWHSRTLQERLIALELMRRKTYGYDENSVPRLQRVLEITTRKHYKPRPAEAENAGDLSEENS